MRQAASRPASAFTPYKQEVGGSIPSPPIRCTIGREDASEASREGGRSIEGGFVPQPPISRLIHHPAPATKRQRRRREPIAPAVVSTGVSPRRRVTTRSGRLPVPALSPAQGVETTACKLRRPRAEVRTDRPRKLSLRDKAFASFDGLGRLPVQRRRNLRRPPPLGYSRDVNRPPERPDRDLDDVAQLNLLRRLDARVVHVNAAAGDRVGREASRFEEARRPKPLVDAHRVPRHARMIARVRP